MRFQITGNWKDGFEHDGMLYCAQRIEEMLMVYTSHLYKVPVFNTFLLACEFMKVYSTVEAKSIDQAHLKNIMEEFVEAFSSDIVIKEQFSQSQIRYYVSHLKGASLPEQRKTMHYLIHVMSEYPNWCVDTLKRTVSTPREKKSIEKALRSYLPMIIGMGYHPQAVYKECKRIFKKSDVDNLDALDSFLSCFNGVDKDYEVYFIVDKRVVKFKTILETRLRISFEQDGYSNSLHHNTNEQCVHISESSLDVNGAASKAYESFNLFMRYYRFFGNRDKEWCGEKCLVLDKTKKTVFSHFGSDRYFYSQDYDDRTLGVNSERVITTLIENTGENDFYKIDKIIRSHNTALSSPDINNAFLNLWSILEIISIDDFSGDKSKIKQVLNNIIPVLTRNYVNRVVEELHDYLKANLSQSQYDELMAAISENGSDEYKIACMISLKECEVARKKACAMLKHFPLIRSRISQLYEDVFKKKRRFVSELKRYEQRLAWHIQRLYRVRNSIVHTGEPDRNMVYLVEHLHSYVDEVVLDMINRMTRQQSLGSISNVLLDAQLCMDILYKEYTKDEPLTAKDVKKLLQ